MTLYVALKGLDDTAFLDGYAAALISSSGHLEGEFSLVIMGEASQPLMFGGASGIVAQAEETQSGWQVIDMRATEKFEWSTRVYVTGSYDAAVTLGFGEARLTVPAKAGAVAIVAVDDIGASIVPDVQPDKPRVLFSPLDGQVDEQELVPLLWKTPYFRGQGFFIKPQSNGRARLSLGGPKSGFRVRHREEAFVSVLPRAELFASAPAQKERREETVLEFEHRSSRRAVAYVDISTQKDPGLRFAVAQNASGETELGAKKITIAGNALRAHSFTSDRLDVRAEGARRKSDGELGATGFGGPEDRLSFALELPAQADLRKAKTQMIYESVLSSAYDRAEAFKERFNGVRIRGLGDARGVQARLDADLAVFEMRDTDSVFHILAGEDDPTPLTYLNDLQGAAATLLPKFDPATQTRRLDVSAGEMALRAAPMEDGRSPITVDGRDKGMLLRQPDLVSAPVGITSSEAKSGGQDGYAEWSLRLDPDENFDAVGFSLNEDGVSAPRVVSRSDEPALFKDKDQWTSRFVTKEPGIEYKSVEEENLRVWIDTWVGKAEIKKEKTKIKTVKTPTGEEKKAYTLFFVTLGFALVEGASLLTKKAWKIVGAEKLLIDLKKLDEDVGTCFVRRNGLKDLVVIYDLSTGTSTPVKDKFIELINNNRPKEEHKRLLLPVGANIGVVLWEKDKDGNELWMDNLAQRIICPEDDATCSPDTMLAVDFSTEGGLDPSDFGRKKDGTEWSSWSDIPDEDRLLWPKARAVKDTGGQDNNKNGPRLDPSDKKWRGIAFRNVPASVLLPGFVDGTLTSKIPAVKNLLNFLQNKLMIRYGWRDANGATFSAGIVEEGKLTPDSMDNIFEIYLNVMTVKGAPFEGKASTIIQAGGKVTAKMPWLTHVDVEGTFQLDLTNKEDVLQSLRVRLNNTGYEGPTSIPGIKSIKVVDFETDLKTANLVLDIVAEKELATALPFLADDKPLRASVFYNISDEANSKKKKINLLLPTEIETKLFGKWDFTVCHISFAWNDTAGSEKFELSCRGRLHLGLPAISEISGELVVTRNAASGDWSAKIVIQGVEIDLEIGGTRVLGAFEWVDLPSEGGQTKEGSVSAGDLANAGSKREFFALLRATGGIFGNGWTLAAKSGNDAGKTYFVGLLEISKTIGLGSMAVRNPALFLAHDADLADGDSLAKAFSDGRNDIIKKLRPTFDAKNTPMAYLSKWKPSDEIGTLVAVSGYLDPQSPIAKPVDEEKYLTSIAYSDQGYFRVDAHAALLGLDYVQRFALTINTKRKYIEAGFGFPTLEFTPLGKSFVVSPGFFALGASYGGPPKLKTSLGWPVLTGEDDYERDWSRAAVVKIEGMWPINTFWGGVQTEVDFNTSGLPERLYFGVAVRAGWTQTFELNGANIAKARAEFGVALGGVFEFEFVWDWSRNAFVPIMDIMRPHYARLYDEAQASVSQAQDNVRQAKSAGFVRDEDADCIDFCLKIMETAAERSIIPDVRLRASIYADVWGSASVEFLGVTIAAASLRAYVRLLACGSTDQGLRKLKGDTGFEFSVTILCVTYRTTARFELILKDEPCAFVGGRSESLRDVSLPKDLVLLKEVA